jgi:hypothetical protein
MKEKKVTTDTKDESKKEKTSRLSPLKKVKDIDY